MANLQDKAAKGDYELMDPLDYLILEKLPEVGTMFAGLYPLGETVKNIAKKFDNKLTSEAIATRLRVLNIQGLTHKTKSVGTKSGGNYVWQRTQNANKVLQSWKSTKGGAISGGGNSS